MSTQAGCERGRSLVSDSIETLVLKVLLYVLAFGASVLISRGLGPEGRGEYYLPIVAAAAMAAACTLGLEQANVFLLGTRGFSVNRLSGQNGLVVSSMGPVGLIASVLLPSLLPAVFADTPVFFLLLAGLTVPFALHAQLSAALLTLMGEVTWQFRVALLAGVIQVALLLGLSGTGWLHVGPVLGVHLCTILLTWLFTVWVLKGRVTIWVRWDTGLLRETLKYSLLLHLGMVLWFLHLRLDIFMVKGLIGTAGLGQYSLSVVLAETVLLATDSLAIAILPRQVGNTLEEAASMALRGARINVLLGIGVASLWGAAGSVVIRIFFGPAFGPAYLPLVGLLPGMVFLGMQRVCGGPVLRTGRPGKITAIYAMSLLCNLALNIWWIPLWGPLGAALASSVSYGLGALLFLTWTARIAKVPPWEGIMPKRSDLASLWRATSEGIRWLQSLPSGFSAGRSHKQ